MKKMLVLDIDGTLTNSKKEVSPATLNKLIELQEKGHIVVLASGRPTPGLMKVAKTIHLEEYGGYLLSFNGAKILNLKTGEIVYQKVLDNSLIKDLYKYAVLEDMGLVTYESDCVITGTRIDDKMTLEARINGLELKAVDDFVNYVDFDVNKCLFTSDEDHALERELHLANLYERQASIYRSEPFFIEVMPVGVDKAASLDILVKKLGMSVEDVIACGDGFNDMSMIKYAGVGVAMANAQEVVKEAADIVTASNDEDGLVPIIDKYILM